VVGDSVWDLLAARRAGTLGVGRLSGGYGEDELESAGAYRVYQDPRDLPEHLDERGGASCDDVKRERISLRNVSRFLQPLPHRHSSGNGATVR